MKILLLSLSIVFAVIGCSSKPYIPSEEELLKRACRDVTLRSKQSVEKGNFPSSYILGKAESLYNTFIESDRRLQAELGECYPELFGHSGIKKNIFRFKSMPEEAKKTLRNEHAKKLARTERDKKVEGLLKKNITPFKTKDVEVSIIQVKGKTAVFEVKAIGNKIVRYNTRRAWQDKITGEIKSSQNGFSMMDNHGNTYYLRKVVRGELNGFNLKAHNDSIRPGQKIILTVVFSDWPVDSNKLTLKVSSTFIGSEIVFEIPTEIWKFKVDYSNLEK